VLHDDPAVLPVLQVQARWYDDERMPLIENAKKILCIIFRLL
jgi:hypothetical protein